MMESCSESDDDFEHVSNYVLSGSESEGEEYHHIETPDSTPSNSTNHLPPCREKKLRCPREGCDKAFNRQARLDEHLRCHDNLRIFKCPYPGCTKDYLRETHLQHHIKSAHTKERGYKCTWKGCGKRFLTGTRLRRHLESHKGQDRYRCQGYEGCNKTFRKKGTLQRHVVSVHEKQQPWSCSETDLNTGLPCTKAFDSADQLRQHKRVHHDPKRFSCELCLEAASTSKQTPKRGLAISRQVYFATYHELQEHNAVFHPPTCPHCSSSFKANKELTRHLEVVHDIMAPHATRERLVHCPYANCNKSYTKQGNLNAHIKINHDRNKHECSANYVSDRFLGTAEVAQAIAIHGSVAEIPFCGVARSTKQSLIDHIRTFHLQMPTKQALRKEAKEGSAASRPVKIAKKPRKDKGILKKSAIEQLAEIPDQVDEDDGFSGGWNVLANGGGAGTVESLSATTEGRPYSPALAPPMNVFEGDILDDATGLTGDMTMYGSHIFDGNGEYHYPSGEYPTDQSFNPIWAFHDPTAGMFDTLANELDL